MLERSLNKKIFSDDVEQQPIRKGYGQGLLEAGERNKNVVALCADLTESTHTHLFRNRFPERFVQVGVGEQSMASVASGMASMGKIPFFSSYAMFSPGRNWEQIRTTICYNDTNAKIAGSHAGISVGPDGGTHQALEDIAITRVIPNMTVIVPCDMEEARKATIEAAEFVGPVYIRLARENTPVITTKDTQFKIGDAEVFFKSSNPRITIFACGSVMHSAMVAANTLSEENIGSIVVNVSTIKPLDKRIVEYSKETNLVLTVESHQRIGGMGSAISELLSEVSPMRVVRIGVDDKFGQSGSPAELLEHYGLGTQSIVKKVKDLVKQ